MDGLARQLAATAAGDRASNGEWRSPLQPRASDRDCAKEDGIFGRFWETQAETGGLPQRLLLLACDVALFRV